MLAVRCLCRPCHRAVLCRAVQCREKGGGRFEQRLAEHAAVLKLRSWPHNRAVPCRQCRGSAVVLPAKSVLKKMTWAERGWGKGRAGTEERTAEVIHQEAHGCAKACGDLSADARIVTRRGAEYPARCGAVVGPPEQSSVPYQERVGLDPSAQPPLCCEGDLCEATFMPTKPDDAPGVGL